MAPVIPRAARAEMFEQFSAKTIISLITITHPQLASPIRLSTDPTQRLTTDPLVYGTISSGDIYKFVLMKVGRSDDQKGSPPRLDISFDNTDAEMVAVIRSFSTPASVSIVDVFADTPDVVIQSMSGLQTVDASYDAQSVTLSLSREPLLMEPHGARMTKDQFPGLHGILSA